MKNYELNGVEYSSKEVLIPIFKDGEDHLRKTTSPSFWTSLEVLNRRINRLKELSEGVTVPLVKRKLTNQLDILIKHRENIISLTKQDFAL